MIRRSISSAPLMSSSALGVCSPAGRVNWCTSAETYTRFLRPPDFRCNRSGEALWLEKCYKPAWVDAQLAIRDVQTDCSAPAASLSSDHAEQLVPPESRNCATPEFVKKLCQQGQVKGAVQALEVLGRTNSRTDKYLVYSVLKECMAKKDLMLGAQVHAHAVRTGFGSDTFLCNHFIRMYAAHGKLRKAMDVYKGVTMPDSFMCSSIISAFTKQGQAERAIELYQDMRNKRMKPDNYVFVAAIQACAAAGDLQSGKQVDDDVLLCGVHQNMFVCTCLIEMYIKCGSLKDARRIFDRLDEKNVVTWTVMIAGYAKVEGMGPDALSLYSAMQNEGIAIPDVVTFVCLLQACANVGVSALEFGRQLHSQIKDRKLEADVALGASVVNMYVKCGSLSGARAVFDELHEKNVVTWNAMIAGYAKVEGMGQVALSLYDDMHNERTAIPDKLTFVCLLQACANVGAAALDKGKQFHSHLTARRLESDVAVGGSLVNMYAKCGSLTDARSVFDALCVKNVVTWNAMISGYAQQEGRGQEALSLHIAMHNEGTAVPNRVTFVCLLQACANVGPSALENAKQLHAQVIERGLESDMLVGGSLVNMYAKCGSLTDARAVFDSLREKNVVTWSAMIAGYAKVDGMGQYALSLQTAMEDEGIGLPNVVTFVCLLQACANVGVPALEKGKQLHSQLKDRGFDSDMVVGGSLVNMYAKCGSVSDARTVFDGLVEKNVVAWNAMIAGYAKVEGMGQEAFRLYRTMRNEGKTFPNAATFVCLFQVCANVGVSALNSGKQLHSQLKNQQLEIDEVLGCSLVNMYAKCGSITNARIVFDRLGEKNVVTWTVMMAGYGKIEGMAQEAFSLYSTMRNEGMAIPDAVTFVCLLQACASIGVSALEIGRQLHAHIKEQNLDSHMAVSASLVQMYATCGSLVDARTVFNGLRKKDLVTWNAVISGYAQQEGKGQEALNLYSAMHNEGTAVPDSVTFVCLLQACANMGVPALEMGKQLHVQITERGLELNLGASLVNMYSKCGSLTDARIVFDRLHEKNVVTWTAMIAGYAQQEGLGQEALSLYSTMDNEGMAEPDAVTFVCLLQACANEGVSALEKGKQLHSQLRNRRLASEMVLGGSLVNMYVKCGSIKDARFVFDRLTEKNVVTWTAMIAGYAQQEGMGQEALNIYSAMRNEGVAAGDALTYVSLLEACVSVGALQQAKELHSEIREGGFESNSLIATCLVKLYAKCGFLDVSRKIFDTLPVKSLVTWNALLKGYAEHGKGGLAIQCFEELLEQGIQPDEVTYICLLTACSHAGLVDDGQRFFETMKERHGVKPGEWHYTCMVDLLGRSGHLDRAVQMLRASDLAGSVVSWTALLSACKSYGDADLGRQCFNHLVNLEPTVATAYVLLGSIYANAGRWHEVDRVEMLRRTVGARKMAAKACIEVKQEVHEFTVGEERSDVAGTLRMMNTRVKEGGHVPQTQLVLRTVSEREREDALCGHAEKLALAYGLLNCPARSTLVVTKNLRMCNDCHSSTKIMSRVEKRDIVVRDAHRVHRFQNGICSCLDRP